MIDLCVRNDSLIVKAVFGRNDSEDEPKRRASLHDLFEPATMWLDKWVPSDVHPCQVGLIGRQLDQLRHLALDAHRRRVQLRAVYPRGDNVARQSTSDQSDRLVRFLLCNVESARRLIASLRLCWSAETDHAVPDVFAGYATRVEPTRAVDRGRTSRGQWRSSPAHSA